MIVLAFASFVEMFRIQAQLAFVIFLKSAHEMTKPVRWSINWAYDVLLCKVVKCFFKFWFYMYGYLPNRRDERGD